MEMTLDEAIIHAEEVADSKERQVVNGDWEKGSMTERDCIECAKEHRQLAEWLKDYKRLKEQDPCDKCVYSTKDSCCQYDDIAETIPPFEPCDDAISRQAALDCITVTKLKQFDFVLHAREEIKKLPPVTPKQKMGCDGCIYEKTGTNSTYPCSHCSRCYTDKYKAENEGQGITAEEAKKLGECFEEGFRKGLKE